MPMDQHFIAIWMKIKKCSTASNGLVKNKVHQDKVTDLWATDIMDEGRMTCSIDLDS